MDNREKLLRSDSEIVMLSISKRMIFSNLKLTGRGCDSKNTKEHIAFFYASNSLLFLEAYV